MTTRYANTITHKMACWWLLLIPGTWCQGCAVLQTIGHSWMLGTVCKNNSYLNQDTVYNGLCSGLSISPVELCLCTARCVRCEREAWRSSHVVRMCPATRDTFIIIVWHTSTMQCGVLHTLAFGIQGYHTLCMKHFHCYARDMHNFYILSAIAFFYTWWFVLRLSICLLNAWTQNCLQMNTTASSSFLNLGWSLETLSTRLSPTLWPINSSCLIVSDSVGCDWKLE